MKASNEMDVLKGPHQYVRRKDGSMGYEAIEPEPAVAVVAKPPAAGPIPAKVVPAK